MLRQQFLNYNRLMMFRIRALTIRSAITNAHQIYIIYDFQLTIIFTALFIINSINNYYIKYNS